MHTLPDEAREQSQNSASRIQTQSYLIRLSFCGMREYLPTRQVVPIADEIWRETFLKNCHSQSLN